LFDGCIFSSFRCCIYKWCFLDEIRQYFLCYFLSLVPMSQLSFLFVCFFLFLFFVCIFNNKWHCRKAIFACYPPSPVISHSDVTSGKFNIPDCCNSSVVVDNVKQRIRFTQGRVVLNICFMIVCIVFFWYCLFLFSLSILSLYCVCLCVCVFCVWQYYWQAKYVTILLVLLWVPWYLWSILKQHSMSLLFMAVLFGIDNTQNIHSQCNRNYRPYIEQS